jgi:hypothetical protein
MSLSLEYIAGFFDGEGSMLAASQDGKCAICKQPERRTSLCVDHDHVTGRVRGLLCHRCNIVLGFVNDNPTLLACCGEYLRAHKN